jgi:hypothetical protein
MPVKDALARFVTPRRRRWAAAVQTTRGRFMLDNCHNMKAISWLQRRRLHVFMACGNSGVRDGPRRAASPADKKVQRPLTIGEPVMLVSLS